MCGYFREYKESALTDFRNSSTGERENSSKLLIHFNKLLSILTLYNLRIPIGYIYKYSDFVNFYMNFNKKSEKVEYS